MEENLNKGRKNRKTKNILKCVKKERIEKQRIFLNVCKYFKCSHIIMIHDEFLENT